MTTKITSIQPNKKSGILEIHSLTGGHVKRDVMLRMEDIRAVMLWGPEPPDTLYSVSLTLLNDSDIEFYMLEAAAREFYNHLREVMNDSPKASAMHYSQREKGGE